MRAMVMLLWSCSYTVMLTSLRESFMEGRGERNGEEQERERQQTKFNIRKRLRPFVPLSFLNKTVSIFSFDYGLLCQTSPFREKRVRPSRCTSQIGMDLYPIRSMGGGGTTRLTVFEKINGRLTGGRLTSLSCTRPPVDHFISDRKCPLPGDPLP